jgi:hypothetical protein
VIHASAHLLIPVYPGDTHLNNIINVPTKLATPMFANATERSRHTDAVARLNSTRMSMNFQYAAGVLTSPMSGYEMAANTNGGTTRSGSISKRTFAAK